MKLIRVITSLFLFLELIFGALFAGGSLKKYEMPSANTSEYTKYVNAFIGTGGIPWSCGMLSPAATVPFGCVRLGADTCAAGGTYVFKTNTSGYYYEHNHIYGFSLGRLSGTGIRDYGMFRSTPFSKESEKPSAIAYSHDNETASPGYYALYLPTEAVLCEMTATSHAGLQRYTFDTKSDAKIYIDAASTLNECETKDAKISIDKENRIITGEVTLLGEFSSRYEGMKVYCYTEFDTPVTDSVINDEAGLTLHFGNIKGKPVTLKTGISFVSIENAKNNLFSEVGSLGFDDVQENADNTWNSELSKIAIDADEDTKEIFYSSLYHTMIMPTDFTDSNGEYVGFDKEVHTAEGYTYRTDMSLWDTARNVNALYCLIEKDIQNDCINSLLNMADTGGTLPRWPMGEGYTGSMLGNPANLVLTESYLKGFSFDTRKALSYMRKSSESFTDTEVREYGDLYEEYGYVPDDLVRDQYRGLSVSRTLEYAWADGAIATFAEAIGEKEIAEIYAEKSQRYKNVWNDETKYFQAKNSDSTWGEIKPNMTAFYDEVLGFDFSKAYCEGSARQWRFSALNDIDGMIALFGSEEYFVSELEAFMEDASLTRASFNPGAGYWIGNQHDIHTAYLFNNAGRADLTQKWVRWTLANRYSTDIDGLDGNDDGGTLSAWYVFSALGFYPIAGTDTYWIGSPCVYSGAINLSNGKTLKISVLNQCDDNIYVDSITLNGKQLQGYTITHADIADGGELVFTMK